MFCHSSLVIYFRNYFMQVVNGLPSFIQTINSQIVRAGGPGFNTSVRWEGGAVSSYFFSNTKGEVVLHVPSLIKVASRSTLYDVGECLTYERDAGVVSIYSTNGDSIMSSEVCCLIQPSSKHLIDLCHTLGFSTLNISHGTIKWLFDT